MGKKTRKTRWRTLSINGPQSDSEDHNGDATATYYQQHRPRDTRTQHQNTGNRYYNHHSSQSTPTRTMYRSNDQLKSTRSSSTASDNKITFNEDEYTRITTPRQDVLFKKGYLSKPKPYLLQQQQSTGGTSTGGSTGNGTPDHHSADGTESTDVEYEQSPYIFPHSYIDQNGICYINGMHGFEPYPVVVYNTAPVCYPPYVPSRVKRYSTDSMTESTSPNTETHDHYENGDVMSNGSHSQDFANPPVFNVLYPGYVYGNGVYQQPEIVQDDVHSTDPRRLKKKRRRRKVSRSKPSNEGATTNGYSDAEYSSEADDLSESEESVGQPESNNQSPPPQLVITDYHASSNRVHNQSPPVDVNCHLHHTPHSETQSPLTVETSASSEKSNHSDVNDTTAVLCEQKEEDKSDSSVALNDGTAAQVNLVNNIEKSENNQLPSDEAANVITVNSESSANCIINNSNESDETTDDLEVVVVAVKNEPNLLESTTTVIVPNTVVTDESTMQETDEIATVDDNDENNKKDTEQIVECNSTGKPKYRVDAEEFVPRAYRHQHSFVNHVPITNFFPLPIINDMYPPNFPGPPFLPPINFIPGVHHYDKFIPNFIPNQYFINQEQGQQQQQQQFYVKNETSESNHSVVENNKSIEQTTVDEEVQTVIDEADKPIADDKQNDNVNINDSTENPADVVVTKVIENTVVEEKKKMNSKPTQNYVLKNENNRTPKKYVNNDRRQNSYERPQFKKMNGFPKTTDTANKPNPLVATNNKVEQATFSRMLIKTSSTSSVQDTNNKSDYNRPVYKKQTSLNSAVKPIIKEAPKVINNNNYSETVKKQLKQSDNPFPRLDRHRRLSENSNQKTKPVEEDKIIKKQMDVMRSVSVDSWINVSSRKKRKNKSSTAVNDFVVENSKPENGSVADFEPSIEECVAEIEKTYERQQEELKAHHPVIEPQENANKMEEITIIKEENVVVKKPAEISNKPVSSPSAIKSEKKSKKDTINKPKNNNKVNNKNSKRIIINDGEIQSKNHNHVEKNMDNTETIMNIKENPIEKRADEVKEVEAEEVMTIITTKIKEPEIIIVTEIQQDLMIKPSAVTEEETIKIEDVKTIDKTVMKEVVANLMEEKPESITKSKKKKRKSKTSNNKDKVLTQPQNSPNISTASMEESYDFLMETSTISDADSKTNVEVSLEIDKMIQRGLYANLEEKLKTFNPSDSFIKSVTTENFNFDLIKSPENTNVYRGIDTLKNIDFSGVFFNTTMNKTLEKAMVNKVTSKNIDGTDMTVLLKKTTTPTDKKENHDDDIKKNNNEDNIIVNGLIPGSDLKGKHFPITQAVKEWMYKTRENTPEIELLKSVNEIRNEYLITNDNELVESEETSDVDDKDEGDELNGQKNGEVSLVRVPLANGKRVTVKNGYSLRAREISHENSPDLLEYWEPDIVDVKICTDDNNKFLTNGKSIMQNGKVPDRNGHIDQAEDVLEVYESVYGKNMDFLEIQKEAEDKKNKNDTTTRKNFSRDGGLPYRAICCNVM